MKPNESTRRRVCCRCGEYFPAEDACLRVSTCSYKKITKISRCWAGKWPKESDANSERTKLIRKADRHNTCSASGCPHYGSCTGACKKTGRFLPKSVSSLTECPDGLWKLKESK